MVSDSWYRLSPNEEYMSYMAFTGGQSVGNIKFMCEIHLEIRGFAFSEEVDFPREI